MPTVLAKKPPPLARFVNAPEAMTAVETYEMANLFPRDTGLPMTVWVSPRGRARHDARVKVCMTPGDRMDASNTAVVAIRPRARLVSGTLATPIFTLVAGWIALNEDALLGYWDGVLSTVELVTRLKSVPGKER